MTGAVETTTMLVKNAMTTRAVKKETAKRRVLKLHSHLNHGFLR